MFYAIGDQEEVLVAVFYDLLKELRNCVKKKKENEFYNGLLAFDNSRNQLLLEIQPLTELSLTWCNFYPQLLKKRVPAEQMKTMQGCKRPR